MPFQTVQTMAARACGDPACLLDHDGHKTGAVVITPPCHDAGFVAAYYPEGGVLGLQCKECNAPIVGFLIADKEPEA